MSKQDGNRPEALKVSAFSSAQRRIEKSIAAVARGERGAIGKASEAGRSREKLLLSKRPK